MLTLDELRVRYGRLPDEDLQRLTTANGLTPQARQALAEEVARRGLRHREDAPALSPAVIRPPTSSAVWQYPKAPIGTRFLAYLIDGFIGIFVPLVAAAIPLITSRGHLSPINVVLLISTVVWAIYYSFTKDAWDKGRSIGKRAMGLMVVNITTNKPCSMGESSLRTLLRGIVSAVPLVGSLIEPLVLIVNEKGRRIGDMVAGTQVIDSKLYDPDAGDAPIFSG